MTAYMLKVKGQRQYDITMLCKNTSGYHPTLAHKLLEPEAKS